MLTLLCRGGRSGGQEVPQQYWCTRECHHVPSWPYSSCCVLHHPAVGSNSTQPWAGFPQSHFVSLRRDQKLHWQSLAASSHNRAFSLMATSVKPAMAIYLNSILTPSRRVHRLKDKNIIFSPVWPQIHSYFPFISAGAKKGFQAIAFQWGLSLAESNQVNTFYCVNEIFTFQTSRSHLSASARKEGDFSQGKLG